MGNNDSRNRQRQKRRRAVHQQEREGPSGNLTYIYNYIYGQIIRTKIALFQVRELF